MSKFVQVAVWLTHDEVSCFAFSPADAGQLTAALPELELSICTDHEEFLDTLPRAEIALVWQFRQEWFDLAPRLRWIATPAAGRDYFGIVPPDGLKLSYGTFHGQLMAETVLAMMLGQARGLIEAARIQAQCAWPRARLAARMVPLRGSHVVILGFGHIGEWIARLAKPFGVRITGVKRHPIPRPPYLGPDDRIAAIDGLDKILPEADHLVLCLPRGPETDNLLDRRRLGLLPTSANVYNVGRGNAIDESALAEALQKGQIAGACLDVFAKEPPGGDSALRRCPSTLLMPHVSACGPNYMSLFVEDFVRQYREWSACRAV